MNIENLNQQELIFRLGYNMGMVSRYRTILKEIVPHLVNLDLSGDQYEESLKINKKILKALAEEDQKLTESIQMTKEEYQDLITKAYEALDME